MCDNTFILDVPEASVPAVEICWLMSLFEQEKIYVNASTVTKGKKIVVPEHTAGIINSAKDTCQVSSNVVTFYR